mmetsp:Transcript_11570/g.21634  ORF Transcript_11570/g.21634 Transcript_11570/m.21634 type:complete len:86 (-) Transcript_11570:71-328(-)
MLKNPSRIKLLMLKVTLNTHLSMLRHKLAHQGMNLMEEHHVILSALQTMSKYTPTKFSPHKPSKFEKIDSPMGGGIFSKGYPVSK